LAPSVVWVSFAPLEKSRDGYTSEVASARYRLTLPAAALERSGWPSRVSYLGPQANKRTVLARFDDARAVVFGKVFAESGRRALELAELLRARGIKLVADFCDDHFADPQLGALYQGLAHAADCVTVSTPELAQVLEAQTASPVRIVTDPVEGARAAVRTASNGALRLLWYGHPTNLDTLIYGMPQLKRFADSRPIRLTLVSSGASVQGFAGEIGARFVPWSTHAVFAELQQCDAVLIPSNPYDPRRAVKSPNRFTEGLWAGRFVVAHPLPAYEALAEYGWVGEELDEGLRWFADHPAEAAERVTRGQEAIERSFTPAAVAESWKAAILAALEAK
jgi:hypothetical protein